jgi:hypothetical protein
MAEGKLYMNEERVKVPKKIPSLSLEIFLSSLGEC